MIWLLFHSCGLKNKVFIETVFWRSYPDHQNYKHVIINDNRTDFLYTGQLSTLNISCSNRCLPCFPLFTLIFKRGLLMLNLTMTLNLNQRKHLLTLMLLFTNIEEKLTLLCLNFIIQFNFKPKNVNSKVCRIKGNALEVQYKCRTLGV